MGEETQAYVSPDLSTHEGTGTIPDSEKSWHEARNKAQQDEVAAAEKHEKEQAEAKAKEQEAAAKEDAPAKTTAKSGSG